MKDRRATPLAHLLHTAAICLLSLVWALAAPQAPARDRTATVPPIGTASLSGRVVTDETPARPVRRASVRLSGVEQFGGELVITDDQGNFVFTNLIAGRYMLTASRPGFVAASYGAKRSEGPGSAIGVTDGQHVTDIVIRVLPGAVITGTIRDQNGEPVADQTVAVMRYRFNQNGLRTLQQVSRGFGERTDDRGVYRVFGLPPGEYLVIVTQGIGPRGGNDLHQMTSADVQLATRLIQDATRPGTASSVVPPPAAPNVVYAPVFYPGTPLEADATKITLRAGEERSGVDMPLMLVPTANITGTVTSADGPVPASLQVSLLAHERIEGLPFSGFVSSPAVENGRFVFHGVTPGTYTIAIRPRPGLVPGQRGEAPPMTPAMLARFGLADVMMNGQDQAVSIALQPGVTVSGRATFEGALAAPADLTRLRVSLMAVITGSGAALGVPAATVDAAGSFSFEGVTPGRYRVTASVPGSSATSGWQPRSATVNGRDAFDTPLEVASVDVGGLTVTFTDRPADLSGTIQDAAGQPTPEYFIIVFASEKTFWTPQSRRIQAKRPSSDGHFSFSNLAPGEYLVAAVTDVEQGEWYDPTFLTNLSPAAIKVTVGEGEKKVQHIRVAR